MKHFCTLFDCNYLPRFMVMYDSLIKVCTDFTIYAFCMDDEAYESLNNKALKSVIPVKNSELESYDSELHAIKSTRSLVEYYFTCTPAICWYVFNKFSNVNLLTYLDSDLYFFSDPESIYDEIGARSVAIVEHRFSRFGKKFLKLGRFNVAWITFRRDEEGIRCLAEYRQQCLEWCFDYLDGDRYADQKYLDKWPEKYKNVAIIQNKGVNLAAWNVGNYSVKMKDENIYIDENKLVFYHFAGFKRLNSNSYTTNISSYFISPGTIVKKSIYSMYISKLTAYSEGDISKKTINPKYGSFSLRRKLKEFFRLLRIYFFIDVVKI